MQFVRLVNKDKRSFDFHQSNQKRIIPKGGELMVPWDVAVSLFGDPSSVDTSRDGARTRAWKQSRGQFGYMDGGMTLEEWETIRPKIEVYDVETGDRIFMVIEDPEGIRVDGNPSMAQASIDTADLKEAIAQQQKQIELLTTMLMQQQQATAPQGQSVVASQDAAGDGGTPGTQAPLPSAEAGEDTPQAVPTGGAGTPPVTPATSTTGKGKGKTDSGNLPPKPDLT